MSQFVRLEQCERFLRFKLAERAGQKFMEDYDVNPQRITPLLSLSGHEFEEGIEKALGSPKALPTSRITVVAAGEEIPKSRGWREHHRHHHDHKHHDHKNIEEQRPRRRREKQS